MTDSKPWNETLVERRVTYSLEYRGRFFLIQNVPARVDVETGERHFSPETVDRLQEVVREECRPVRTIETPVYEFAMLS